MAFTKAQEEAITHFQGPAMVLAGPGSGKTTVITHRTSYLIEQYGIHPGHILVVTFTRAAAEEMKKRFLKIRGEAQTMVRFGTFHSVFFEILKYAYGLSGANIAGEDACYGFLKEIISRISLDVEDEAELLKSLTQEISTVKSEQIPLEHYYSSSVSDEIFRRIYREYQDKMTQSNLLDYDDLLVCTWELLTQREDILAGWQKRYQYILIDEFQDINKLQYEIIRLLARPENNLFIVGDDDQSIYRFRGAKPEIMLQFPKAYPDVHKIVLDYNFRCPGNIVKAAAKVIGRNVTRYDKAIKEVKEEGAPIGFLKFPNQNQESLFIMKKIKEYVAEGGKYDQVAVLYRNNMDARVISQRFMEYNVPFYMRDVIPNIYEHWIARNMIAYLKAAAGNRERNVILQIINRPKRYVGRECLDQPVVDFERLRRYYDDKYWMIKKFDQFESDLRMLQKMDPYTAINYIRHGIGYESYLQEYAEYRKIAAEDLLELLDQLQESARGFQTAEAWFAHIEEYGQMLKNQNQKNRKAENQVTFSTLHSAKGLEYPLVFILDVNEGIIPYKKAVLQSDVEEERRMFYVGMTRASEKLYICSIKEKNGKPLKDSPFLMGIATYSTISSSSISSNSWVSSQLSKPSAARSYSSSSSIFSRDGAPFTSL